MEDRKLHLAFLDTVGASDSTSCDITNCIGLKTHCSDGLAHCWVEENLQSHLQEGAGIAQSVYCLVLGRNVCGSSPGGGRFSALVQTDPASCTMGTGFFTGGEAAGAWR